VSDLNLDAAIEAAARAFHAAAVNGGHADPSAPAWDELDWPSRQVLTETVGAAMKAAAPLIERAVREHVAYRIRAELVCCDQYEELAEIRAMPGFTGEVPLSRQLRLHGDGICYWGEAAARIAHEMSPPASSSPNSIDQVRPGDPR
jgi:hypothetical protein